MANAPPLAALRWLRPPYPLWALLAVPALVILLRYAIFGAPYPSTRDTGLISVWLLVLSLSVTPLSLMFGPRRWILWLRANRRYIGVASFFYGLLHTLIFFKRAKLSVFLDTFTAFPMQAGWVALVIMLAMTITSTDGYVRRMGRGWKLLQQTIYAASALIMIHWVLTVSHYDEMVIYTLPIVLLTIWRLWRNWRRSRLP